MSRQIRWIAGIAVTLAFPAGALVAGLAYLALRRRWSDRLVAAALAVLAGGASYLAYSVLDYWGAWQRIGLYLVHLSPRPADTADWVTVAGMGAALGPALVAVVWR